MCSFKSLRVLIRSFILRYITGLWIYLRYFVRFTFHLFCWFYGCFVGFFINHSSVYPFSSIVCKHVEGGFHPSFSISCFSHGIKLTFVRGTITDDYLRQYYVNVTSIVTWSWKLFFVVCLRSIPVILEYRKKRILKTEGLKRGSSIYLAFLTVIYLFKINNKNRKALCEICHKLTRKAPDQMCETNSLQMCSFSIILTSLHSLNLSFPMLFSVICTAMP